jgi:hypothetical protein
VRVGKGQCKVILYGEGWEGAAYWCIVWWGLGRGSVMLYYVVRVGKGQRYGIFCGEVWESAA